MISKLEIKNFTCFAENSFEFSPNINVLVGANGTGKTHVLKILFAFLGSAKIMATEDTKSSTYVHNDVQNDNILDKEFSKAFKSDDRINLINKDTLSDLNLNIEFSNNTHIGFTWSGYSLNQDKKVIAFSIKIPRSIIKYCSPFVYIPPREMLSLFDGFLALNEKREISFDETYIELARSLDVPLLKGEGFEEGKRLIEPLTTALNVEVIKENGRFYVRDAEGRKLEAHLVAEGWRKLASIMYLALNGELARNSVLFWDEPEANLNPRLIRAVAQFINHLAKQGVQIFIATHDYLLTHYLSLDSEYAQENDPQTKFFCLSKNNNGIVVERGSTLADLENNPIMEEYAAYYDAEQDKLSSNQSS